jgi:lipopolysaccharide transport system ATP-binding protein
MITVENLGKRYRLGAGRSNERYTAMRDVIAQKAAAPFRALSRKLESRKAKVENGLTSDRGSLTSSSAEEFWALKDVSFEVKRGEVLGIIGRNGAGKSTLLKILSRITEPTEGRIKIKGRVASLLEVGTGFHPELTGRENIYLNGAILGMHRHEIKAKFDEIVAFAEVEKFLDTPVKRYSSGMYVRLAFAVAAHLEPEILIVDEVLAVGDADFQKKCLGKMQQVAHGEGRTVLFVSHNMAAIAALCSIGVVLERGRIAASGEAAYVVNSYLQRFSTPSVGGNLAFDKPRPDVAGFEINAVSMIDDVGDSVSVAITNKPITFRVAFKYPETTPHGSVAIVISTMAGYQLVIAESHPQQLAPFSNESLGSVADCRVSSLPLVPGTYYLGIGLALFGVRRLCWEDYLTSFLVVAASEDDNYDTRGSLALDAQWQAIQ